MSDRRTKVELVAECRELHEMLETVRADLARAEAEVAWRRDNEWWRRLLWWRRP